MQTKLKVSIPTLGPADLGHRFAFVFAENIHSTQQDIVYSTALNLTKMLQHCVHCLKDNLPLLNNQTYIAHCTPGAQQDSWPQLYKHNIIDTLP